MSLMLNLKKRSKIMGMVNTTNFREYTHTPEKTEEVPVETENTEEK